MRDRFDITFEHNLDTKADGDAGGAGAGSTQRVEVITDGGRRRQWSTDEKARILFESLLPNANVSAVARRHGMSPQQLFDWRREAREQMAADAKAKRLDRVTPDRRGTSFASARGWAASGRDDDGRAVAAQGAEPFDGGGDQGLGRAGGRERYFFAAHAHRHDGAEFLGWSSQSRSPSRRMAAPVRGVPASGTTRRKTA